MTLQEIIDVFRELADDVEAPYLWSDAFAKRVANEGQTEACRRARLLVDETTTAVCQIPVVANTAIYAVDPRVLFIRRAKLASQDRPLGKIHPRDLDRYYPGWETNDATTPLCWAPHENHGLRLIDKPDADDTLNLVVVRLPLAPMVLADALATPPVTAVGPEIDERFQLRLVDWMLYRAFMSRDRQEKYRPDEAAARLAEFEGEFGKRSSAIDETWINREHGYQEFEGLY